ncbi:MAG TPA: 2-oxoglutarate and iron-dependent oxygenase domain-containing protein [Polyangiaceae bacterium]|jgi:isopenicillin N synthase-like dioxygenase|nr:2-oxoglutarate and iron-dependent oxygenase domain-containing protein [Polyangiaceae bacterium]
MALVPLVDLQPWRSGDRAAEDALARAIDDACGRVGFLQIVGHGIPDSVVSAMLAETNRFFALPLADKQRLRPAHIGINRGYAGFESESLAYSLGGAQQSLPDRFEAFNVGPDVVPDDAYHRQAPHDFFAPNLWPEGLDQFRPAVTRYFAEASRVAFLLTEAFGLALGLGAGWFRPFVDRSTLTLRIVNYERNAGEAPPAPGQLRMGAHTDYGMLTVLYADDAPGLEIFTPEGDWQAVRPEPGALLVNLGDLTARWTNDRWRSTLHRVALPPAELGGPAKRRSAAFFLDANYDAPIECLPTCLAPGASPRYPVVSAGEHLIAKLLGPRAGVPSQIDGPAREP